MLYIFNSEERLQAVLQPSDMPGGYQETFQYNQGYQYDTGLQYKKWSDKDPCPYWDAIHHEVLNGENTFTFTIPAGHPFAQYVTEGNLVAFKDLDLDFQLFEVKRVTDIHGDGLTRTAFCENAFYELLDDFIEDVRPTEVSATFALTQALSGTRWEPGIVDDFGLNGTNYYYESALSGVQKVTSVWGGERRARVVITGGVISGRYVDLLARRGADTGKQWEYGRHTINIEREIDLTTTKTALYGRGKGVETETGGFGRRLNFADVEWSVANGDPVDKPLGQEWVGDPDALAQWGRPGGRHRFGAFEDSEEEDAASLLQNTWDKLQELKTPRGTYQMTVLDLERLSGYEHEKVRIGDTTRGIDRKFSPVLLVSARVVVLDRDLLRPENTRVTLGNFAPSLADNALVQQRINRAVSAAFSPSTGTLATAWLDGIVNLLQNQLKAATTNFYTDENGAFIWEAVDGTAAMKVVGGMFSLANAKIIDTQEWDWRAFGTGNGFTADEFNAGTLNAALVKIQGNTYFYWDGDYLYIVDPADQNKQIRLSKEGIRLTADGGQTWTVAISVDGVMADAIVAATLSAISADLGTVTAGKLIGLQIFSTLFRSGAEGATSYVEIDAGDSPVRVVRDNKTAVELWTAMDFGLVGGSGGAAVFRDTAVNDQRGYITAYHDDTAFGNGLLINAEDASTNGKDLIFLGDTVQSQAREVIVANPLGSVFMGVIGEFKVYTGPKDSVNMTEHYGLRSVYVRESPEIRFIDEGMADIENGICTITIDPILLEVIESNTEKTRWTFQLTPMFKHMDLCVLEVGETYFKVQEKDGLSGQFCWKMSAVRKGFAGYRMLEDSPEHDFLTSNWEDELSQYATFTIDETVLYSNWEDELIEKFGIQ